MPSSPNSLLTLCEAMVTASLTTLPRLTKNARMLSPVEIEIERVAAVGGGTVWGASLNGRGNALRSDFVGDGASTTYDTAIPFVAFANYNWMVRTDRSTRTGTATIAIGSTTVTGSGTAFATELAVGDEILINGERRTVLFITSATVLTVDRAYLTAGATLAIALVDALLPVTTDWAVSNVGGIGRITFTAAAKAPLGARFDVHFVVPVAKFTFATALLTFKRLEVPGADIFWYVSDATGSPSATNIYIAARDQ